ncbi:MAG: hypothetical protein HYV35_03545 [Lentisphaerae bacterium]|nr:hypothetical protein [Lentisphaerota bacterium]
MKTGIQQFACELFYALPLALMLLLALTPGISFTEDLGRHLLLGKIIVERGYVPATNFLTYTYPDFPFINHHWLSEVVFYWAYRAVGLNGLIALKALLMCSALALALRSGEQRRASPLIVLAATLSAVALGYRAHIRPELFTYLGVALYGWFIARAELSPERKIPGWGCGVLLAYGWFWANAHIYFIFGLGMLGAYMLACWWRFFCRTRISEGVLCHRAWPRAETFLLLALVGVNLLNPNGWRGVLYPLGIFGNYGIAITENASPLSYWQTVLNPMMLTMPLLSLLALLVFGRACRCHNESNHGKLTADLPEMLRISLQAGYADNTDIQTKGHLFDFIRAIRGKIRTDLTAGQLAGNLILLAALIAAWRMLRSAPLLALTVLPPLCAFPHFIKCGNTFLAGWLRGTGIAVVVMLNLSLAFGVVEGSYCRIFPSPIGPTPFGLDDEQRYLALRRLQAEGLPGPVFSDYNSGSLVEYNLYPQPGYVDNRPEAFPAEFWQQEYTSALSLGAAWEDLLERRGIQTVAVSLAGVKEHFIRALLADPRWQLVHLDFFFAVFVRRTPANQDFLQRHAFGTGEIARFAGQTAQRLSVLPSESLWRRQVLADQIVYEIYALICVGAGELAWPLVWEMHLRYPDYQLVHELMRVSAPNYAWPAVMDVMAGKARWPLAAKQVLDYGAALEAQGRTNEARAVYRRGRIFFPLSTSPR